MSPNPYEKLIDKYLTKEVWHGPLWKMLTLYYVPRGYLYITEDFIEDKQYDVIAHIRTLLPNTAIIVAHDSIKREYTLHFSAKTVVKCQALSLQAGGSHYKELKIQPTEYCQLNGLNTCESNIVKYATRHRQKGELLDVEKIIHYALLLAELDYGVKPTELGIIKELMS